MNTAAVRAAVNNAGGDRDGKLDLLAPLRKTGSESEERAETAMRIEELYAMHIQSNCGCRSAI